MQNNGAVIWGDCTLDKKISVSETGEKVHILCIYAPNGEFIKLTMTEKSNKIIKLKTRR